MSPPAPNESRRFQFADLTLDGGQRRVFRGEKPVALSNLSFELLRVLVEAAPNVVAHDELASKAWGPRRIVTPENVAQRVMLLRQALGDQAEESRYIEGVRGRGYRLIPGVRLATDEARPMDDARRDDAIERSGSDGVSASRVPRWAYVTLALLGLGVALLAFDAVRLRVTSNVGTGADERPFSFVVSEPKGSPFGAAPSSPEPALSPDGRQLAFLAPVQGQRMLWLQTLGELEAQVIPGTEGADLPFWSPDGEFIAFAARGQLTRVAADGLGAPQGLAPVAGPFYGGAWAPDGSIVFARGGRLHRVIAGGEAAALTMLDADKGEFSHRYPEFLPDSNRFVYLVLSTQPDHEGIYLGSLDEPSGKIRLVASAASAEIGIGNDGRPHLLFVNDAGALLAQPFDAALARLTGNPVVVASQPVEPGPSVRAAPVTAAGRVLAYRPQFAPTSRLVWFDRRGVRSELVAAAGQNYRFPALSDDGTKLAAMRDDGPATAGLWWLDLQRGANPERLTRGGELMSTWLPDGRGIVYSAPRPEGWGLFMQPIAERGAAQLLLAGPNPLLKRIRDATDGFLVFQDAGGELWLRAVGGEAAARTLIGTPALENHARVSPNGRWVAFSSTDANVTRVYVTTFPEPSEWWPVSPAGGSDPHWRSDGRELYYVRPDDVLMAVEVETDETFVIGRETALFDARFDEQSRSFGSAYAPAPDGQRFLVAELAEVASGTLIVTKNWAPESPAIPR